MLRLWLDLETRSRLPIKHGSVRYSKDVEVMIAGYAPNDAPVIVRDLMADGPPQGLIRLAKAADEIWAHNAEFDRVQLETTTWWPDIPLERWRCTAALARMHGLPGGLDKLCQIFKLPEEQSKSSTGKNLIQLFCIPKKDGTFNDAKSHPLEWAEFVAYGAQDVVAMRAVYKKIPHWNSTPRMWSFWHLDQRMNERGVKVDLELCQGAVEATTRAKRRLATKTDELTLGLVERTTQRNRLMAYMSDYGVDLPDLTADTVERRLNDENLPEHIKELLRIRQQASKASTAKYQRALNQHVGGRLRNLLVFCGAARTGRWAGRTLQPHNLPRPKHPQWDIEEAIERFRTRDIEAYAKEEVLGLAASCLRGTIISDEGRTLAVADLANIEGRDMAWIAGETWKLKAFADFDAKNGPDLYKVSYGRAFNIDPNTISDDDWRRQIGKVMELALQYYGGVGAFCVMAETYSLVLEDLAAAAWSVLPEKTKAAAKLLWIKAQRRRRTYGLEERVWIVCQSLVLVWRQAHPAITKFWKDLENAVSTVIRVENKSIPVGRVVLDRLGNWLRVLLPSDRYLCYPAPKIDFDTRNASFVGIDPYTQQWGRVSTYSGKLAENIVQGNSADILMDGLLAADRHGYNPVLSVHDEAITEPLIASGLNDKGLSKLMISSSPWAVGMPLAAKGFTATRYRK